jgi:hypothetical protein
MAAEKDWMDYVDWGLGVVQKAGETYVNVNSGIKNGTPYVGSSAGNPTSNYLSGLLGSAAQSALPGIQYLPYVLIGGVVLVVVSLMRRK